MVGVAPLQGSGVLGSWLHVSGCGECTERRVARNAAGVSRKGRHGCARLPQALCLAALAGNRGVNARHRLCLLAAVAPVANGSLRGAHFKSLLWADPSFGLCCMCAQWCQMCPGQSNGHQTVALLCRRSNVYGGSTLSTTKSASTLLSQVRTNRTVPSKCHWTLRVRMSLHAARHRSFSLTACAGPAANDSSIMEAASTQLGQVHAVTRSHIVMCAPSSFSTV